MYVPKHFAVDDLASQHDLIDACDFGIVVSNGADGLFATHIPMMLTRDEGAFGTLYGHVARANPHVGLFGDGGARRLFRAARLCLADLVFGPDDERADVELCRRCIAMACRVAIEGHQLEHLGADGRAV